MNTMTFHGELVGDSIKWSAVQEPVEIPAKEHVIETMTRHDTHIICVFVYEAQLLEHAPRDYILDSGLIYAELALIALGHLPDSTVSELDEIAQFMGITGEDGEERSASELLDAMLESIEEQQQTSLDLDRMYCHQCGNWTWDCNCE